jgi:hypothetical protein
MKSRHGPLPPQVHVARVLAAAILSSAGFLITATAATSGAAAPLDAPPARRAARTLAPADMRVHALLGRAYHRRRALDLAVESYRAAVAAKPRGARMKTESSGPPASSRQTLMLGFSDSRPASTQPAEPPPTTM